MNYNKVILAGNLTRKPEMAYLPNQTAVAKFGLAINRVWKDKSETCFIDCTAFGKTAENISKYLGKGDPIMIDGRLKFETWEKDGQRRSKHCVIVGSFQFIPTGEKQQAATEPELPTINANDIPF